MLTSDRLQAGSMSGQREKFAANAVLYEFARRGKRKITASLGIDQRLRFRGSYATHAEALASVAKNRLAGYDNDAIAAVSYEEMCKVHIWDYPVIHWLGHVLAGQSRLIDAGGHMGTKYRAFLRFLDLPDGFDWAVLDVPAIVRAGEKLAREDGIEALSFYDRAEDLPESDILLASGLFQYLDANPAEFIARLKRKPRHLIINKVATREGESIVTLERFPGVDVPYQVRNREGFESNLDTAGYAIRDQWTIPSISRRHRAFGQATSRGYYAELRQ